MNLSPLDEKFLDLLSAPDSVYWFRAFLRDHKTTAENSEYEKEILHAITWIGRMLSHSGSMAVSFFSQKRMTKSLGEMYMPDHWRKFLRARREDGRDSIEDAASFHFGARKGK